MKRISLDVEGRIVPRWDEFIHPESNFFKPNLSQIFHNSLEPIVSVPLIYRDNTPHYKFCTRPNNMGKNIIHNL